MGEILGQLKEKKGKEMNIWGFTVFSALEHFVNIC